MKENFFLTLSSTIESSDVGRRIIAGVVLPFNKIGNTSAGPVIFESGSVQIPDAKRIKLLAQHNATDPIGRAQNFQVTQDAIYGTFKISASTKGTDYLTLAAEDLISSLSIGVDVLKATENADGVLVVSSAVMKEVSLVESPAYADAVVTKVAASESEAEAVPTQPTTESEAILDTTPEPTATPVVDTPVEAARPTVSASFYTEPRSPIKTQAQYLEHTVKATMGNHDSAIYIKAADATALKIEAANNSFNTNPAFSPVQYSPSVIDTSLMVRPTIDALGGARALSPSGMTIAHPKITTNATISTVAEGASTAATQIVSSYVNATVVKLAGTQIMSTELLDRSDPSFYAAMYENCLRAYAKASDSAVIAEIVSGGTQSTAQAATIAGYQAYVAQAAPAVFAASGQLGNAFIAGTSVWSSLIGAIDTTGRPIFTASQPMNASGQSAPTSLRGSMMGLDLYVDPYMVATNIDDSAFIVTPSAICIYESPKLTLSVNVVATGEISVLLYGYFATKTLISGGLQRYNLT
jgi:HK97 family phage prohead protease